MAIAYILMGIIALISISFLIYVRQYRLEALNEYKQRLAKIPRFTKEDDYIEAIVRLGREYRGAISETKMTNLAWSQYQKLYVN
jgi:hypothetical protein